ncbi:MAG: PA2169 family four-helix-bundle protein [Planctomycetia bacterium]|nr:PA2169 family four-helix-bundle protein [Planctomycetia bacterium]
MMEIVTKLNDETIAEVRNLAAAVRDSQVALTDASAKVSDKAIVRLFYRLAVERANMGQELNDFVRDHDDQPPQNPSWLGQLQDVSTQIGAAVNADDADVVLREVERSEAMIVAEYEKLLPRIVGSPLSDVLLQQLDKVRAGHDAICKLRDSRKS